MDAQLSALVGGAEVVPLSGGYSGETFLVTGAGEQAVLRLYARRPERAAVDQALLDRVRGLLPVPRVLEAVTVVAGALTLLATERMPRPGMFVDASLDPAPFPPDGGDQRAFLEARLGAGWY